MNQAEQNSLRGPVTPRHGHVFTPASRAYFAWQAGMLDEGALNQREAGKFFPQTQAGLTDPFAKDDPKNLLPPPDGKIASANQATGMVLDQPGDHWSKHEVRSGDTLDISWYFAANHRTRRYNYFITKPDWDSAKVLARDQFEAEPFHTELIELQPYWAYDEEMKPGNPTTHALQLPAREGYHVLLAVWEVADTGNAFYHVVDLDFLPGHGDDRPSVPMGLKADEVTDKKVSLSWEPSSGAQPIECYLLSRDGIDTFVVPAPITHWDDDQVLADATYRYSISAVDSTGASSKPSAPIVVRTLGEGGVPSAPKDLHSMGQAVDSIRLMWGSSSGASPINRYELYRDAQQVASIAGDRTEHTDGGLQPDTLYGYQVVAVDGEGKVSAPSNNLSVRTAGKSDYPAWRLHQDYASGDLVSHVGADWRCRQAHQSLSEDWAPGAAAALWQHMNN